MFEELADVLCQGVSGKGNIHVGFLASKDLFVGSVADVVRAGVVGSKRAVEDFRLVSFRGGHHLSDGSIHTLSGGLCKAIVLRAIGLPIDSLGARDDVGGFPDG